MITLSKPLPPDGFSGSMPRHGPRRAHISFILVMSAEQLKTITTIGSSGGR
jgi:hypothetical protein